jgi:hypothetical protein
MKCILTLIGKMTTWIVKEIDIMKLGCKGVWSMKPAQDHVQWQSLIYAALDTLFILKGNSFAHICLKCNLLSRHVVMLIGGHMLFCC